MKLRLSVLGMVVAIILPVYAHAVKFTLKEVIVVDDVKYSLQKYVNGMYLPGCPWRQAAPVLVESLPSAKATVRGVGCWIEDASWGDITVWVENENGNNFTRTIHRDSSAGRPTAIISNVEGWDKECLGKR